MSFRISIQLQEKIDRRPQSLLRSTEHCNRVKYQEIWVHRDYQLRCRPKVSLKCLINRSREQNPISSIAETQSQHFAQGCDSIGKDQVVRVYFLSRVKASINIFRHGIVQSTAASRTFAVGEVDDFKLYLLTGWESCRPREIEDTYVLIGKLGYFLDHEILGWELAVNIDDIATLQCWSFKWTNVFRRANIDKSVSSGS